MNECKMLKTVSEVVEDLISTADDLKMLHHILDQDLPKEDDPEKLFCDTYAKIEISRHIRNSYGLWQNNEDLAGDCIKVNYKNSTATYRLWHERMSEEEFEFSKKGLLLEEVHPDDASNVIKIELLKKLRELSVNSYKKEKND